jgi:hypothetical protein
LLHTFDPATIELVRGLAAGLEYPFDHLLRYNLVVFLRDALTTRRPAAGPASEGCTSWAATGPATVNGQPILVKNRDYRLEHLPLQVVVRAEPAQGYRYTYITSAASPGVFVAGFNMAHHSQTPGAICRHPRPGSETSTISATIFWPAQRQMLFCHSQPCGDTYHSFDYV